MDVQDIIDTLKLEPLEQEGGWFSRTYESGAALPSHEIASAAIYYLLQGAEFSHLHRLTVDEVYHFYLGGPVELVELFPDGTGRKTLLGSDIAAGQCVQHVVRAGTWQGSRLVEGAPWALLGTTTCPAYSDDCYEHGDAASLIDQYPSWAQEINSLT